MTCECSLAGTAACKTCRNNPDSMGQLNNFVTGITTVTDTPQITYVPERTCCNISEDGFLCSACLFGDFSSFGFKPNYCPNCGAKVTPKNSETTPKVVSE